ncbi:murein hydrolase activator EnvC family protein [Roseibium marinum]|uniref:Septal ring factor EnvC (AmiA/AmiB activator) n=1 Tax=Roseibium marinum TaxID=281252 RepID=A0A2S3V2W6_9HYPH|nr:peptidoglycan DD-metalloendopeptidase family protein [Roseibium marinum]POF34245.1 septal ring factor EnvC (AmiA/AmiB activator) [Roseibium marinum]
MKPDRIKVVRPGLKKRLLVKPLLGSLLAGALALPLPALATESVDEAPQNRPAATAETDAAAESKKVREEELAALSRDIEVSTDRQAAIAREIRSLDRDRETLNARIIGTSDTIQGLETELTDTERRLRSLGENEDAVRLSLIARRDILSEVLAALQRLGRRPPPALAVRPSDALSAVRSAILLNAVMPELKVETEALAEDLEELHRIRSVIAEEKNRLRGDAMRLAEEKSRLELLLSAKRQEHQRSVRDLEAEKQRAAELAEQAGSLQELIANLETEIESAREAAEKSRQASLETKGKSSRGFDPFSDPGRLAPVIPFQEARAQLPQPVAGTLLKDFGEEDDFGGVTEGQSIATRPGSNVTSPADGWVVYSGPFRSFGQLLILNTGDGYHVLLAGMDRIDAELGQFVLTGEPVGVMGATQWASASTFGLGSTQPILYVEFRKDGRAIDPTPWWAHIEEEKARG